MSVTEQRWCDMSKRMKLAVVGDALTGHEGKDAIMARVERHFRGREMPDHPSELMNVVAREQWRELHGNTQEWDAVAARGGVVVR